MRVAKACWRRSKEAGISSAESGLAFFQGVQVVQAAQEEQVGDLRDDFNGVGNASRPEGALDLVDFAFKVAGEHGGEFLKRVAAWSIAYAMQPLAQIAPAQEATESIATY